MAHDQKDSNLHGHNDVCFSELDSVLDDDDDDDDDEEEEQQQQQQRQKHEEKEHQQLQRKEERFHCLTSFSELDILKRAVSCPYIVHYLASYCHLVGGVHGSVSFFISFSLCFFLSSSSSFSSVILSLF